MVDCKKVRMGIMANFSVNVIGKTSSGGTTTQTVTVYRVKTKAEAIQEAKARIRKSNKNFAKIVDAIAKEI